MLESALALRGIKSERDLPFLLLEMRQSLIDIGCGWNLIMKDVSLKEGLYMFIFPLWSDNNYNHLCRQEIRTSTSSMTSVPKPLKFLRPHYGNLKAYYETMKDSDLKVKYRLTWHCLLGYFI